MKQVCIFFILCKLTLWCSILNAEVRIDITKGVDIARPIGIVKFKLINNVEAPEDIGAIVAADLRNSGKFKPIDASRMPQQPTTVSKIKPAYWTILGIDSVVVGQVQFSDGIYLVSYQLVDTLNKPGAILAQNEYKVTKKLFRYAAHTASDEIFENITGIKGVFRTRIAYVVHSSIGQYPYELRVSDYDGYNQITVHRSIEPLMSPAWSPDGSKLAYVTFETGQSALVIQTLYRGEIQHIASFSQHNGSPAFSPDGSKLAFALSKTGSINLYFIELFSGNIHQITYNRNNNTEPSWFPNNYTIAYTSDQCGHPQVYKIDINGGNKQRLSWESIKNQDADISLDGKFLVMVSSNNCGVQHIAKLDLVTCSIQILTETFIDETPSIAPNGTMLIYSAAQELRSVLKIISTDGRFKLHIPVIDGHVKFPAWSPYLY